MRKILAVLALVSALLSACGKKPETIALDLLKAGDRAQALQVLEAAKAQKPEQAQTRYLLFVIYEYMVSQGEPARHDKFLASAIDEYSWLAKSAGIPADYRDMEGSLKSSEKTKAAYEAAYAAVYGR